VHLYWHVNTSVDDGADDDDDVDDVDDIDDIDDIDIDGADVITDQW